MPNNMHGNMHAMRGNGMMGARRTAPRAVAVQTPNVSAVAVNTGNSGAVVGMMPNGQPMQQINAQQLANIVGPAEALCLTKPNKFTVFQPKVHIQQFPVMFKQEYHTTVPVDITLPAEITASTAPMSQVQLNQCVQPVCAPPPPCPPPCCESACGSCAQGPYLPSAAVAAPFVADVGYAGGAYVAGTAVASPYGYGAYANTLIV